MIQNSENIKNKNSRSVSLLVSIMFPFIAALLPKCPLCVMAILSVLGLSIDINAEIFYPLTFLFILLGLGAMTLQARHKQEFKPLFLGILASMLIIAGKFYLPISIIFYSGLLLFTVAIMWNIFLPEKAKFKAGCKC